MDTATAVQGTVRRDVTRALIERSIAIEYARLPEWVRTLARQCIIDWFAVTLAGARDPLVDLLLDEAREEGGKPVATVVGRGARLTRAQAALVNGTASHVLDYDDVNLNINGHPSAVLVPAALAMGEATDAGGIELLTAFVAGYEFACRAGRLAAPGHYLRGYHATSTVGGLGAAVACARLLRLDPERTATAVGIAATQAAGLKAMFGTQCKPFHAGMAAEHGVRAAALARRGMESRTDALECRQGFAPVMSPDLDPAAALGDPEAFFLRDNLFKYHAACYGTHSAIECARALHAEHRFAAAEIENVTVRVERGSDAVCNIPNPRTGLEAKFSLRLTTAMALCGRDTADLAAYSETSAADPILVAMRDRIKVELVDAWPLMQAEVLVTLRDGRVLRMLCDAGVPGTDYSRQDARLKEKFVRLVQPVLGDARCTRLLERLIDIERTSVRELMSVAGAEVR
ncbi:MAG: MmgE/PrpD family protein [Betaproteobacteria bacterium]|nr:MAG: MmgE/PrpD family protein [Betaproteobacteria bacterium]